MPEELFSIVYSRSYGLDPRPFETFFQTEWQEFVIGKRDLKEHIKNHPELWQWNGTPDQLVNYWCTSEDIRNQSMIDLIQRIKRADIPCYLATEQERYRGEYMKNVMFKDLFDDYFITANIGYKKTDPTFFETILKSLQSKHPKLTAQQIMFFDDSQSKVDAALATGIDAVLFRGVRSVNDKLEGLGLL